MHLVSYCIIRFPVFALVKDWLEADGVSYNAAGHQVPQNARRGRSGLSRYCHSVRNGRSDVVLWLDRPETCGRSGIQVWCSKNLLGTMKRCSTTICSALLVHGHAWDHINIYAHISESAATTRISVPFRRRFRFVRVARTVHAGGAKLRGRMIIVVFIAGSPRCDDLPVAHGFSMIV